MSDLTYDQVLNKVQNAGWDDYGSYGDDEDQDEWGESSEEGDYERPKQKKARRNQTYEKAIFELIE